MPEDFVIARTPEPFRRSPTTSEEPAVPTAQSGILDPVAVGRVAGLGVTAVVGLRPEVWAEVAPTDAVPDLSGFAEPVTGDDGFTMPATQHDLMIWVHGDGPDIVFDAVAAVLHELEEVAVVQERSSAGAITSTST